MLPKCVYLDVRDWKGVFIQMSGCMEQSLFHQLPGLVQEIIFNKLGKERPEQGWFYPTSVYRENRELDPNLLIADQLRFCLICPSFLNLLDIDLDQLPIECLHLVSQFPHLKEKAEEVLRKRIRLNPDNIFGHSKDGSDRWIMFTTAITDFVQPHECFSDWIFRKS